MLTNMDYLMGARNCHVHHHFLVARQLLDHVDANQLPPKYYFLYKKLGVFQSTIVQHVGNDQYLQAANDCYLEGQPLIARRFLGAIELSRLTKSQYAWFENLRSVLLK